MSAKAQVRFQGEGIDFDDGISALLDGVQAALASVARSMRKGRDREHLHRLPDHLLKDVGVSRSEIEHVVAFELNRGDERAVQMIRRCGPAE